MRECAPGVSDPSSLLPACQLPLNIRLLSTDFQTRRRSCLRNVDPWCSSLHAPPMKMTSASRGKLLAYHPHPPPPPPPPLRCIWRSILQLLLLLRVSEIDRDHSPVSRHSPRCKTSTLASKSHPRTRWTRQAPSRCSRTTHFAYARRSREKTSPP